MTATPTHPPSPKTKSRLRLLGGVLIVLTLAVSVAAWCWSNSPSYCLWRIRKNVENRDYPALQTYLDIDSLVSGIADAMLQQTLREVGQTNPELARTAPAVVVDLIKQLKPKFADIARNRIKSFVEMKERAPRQAHSTQALAFSATAFLPDKDTPVKLLRLDKDAQTANARVRLSISAGKDLILELGMKNENGRWRLTEIRNIADLIKESGLR